jgi:hypothetical protein
MRWSRFGRWPRSQRAYQTTLTVPPVPRLWGPGMDDSLIAATDSQLEFLRGEIGDMIPAPPEQR